MLFGLQHMTLRIRGLVCLVTLPWHLLITLILHRHVRRYIAGSDRAREARAAGFGAPPGIAEQHQPPVSAVQRHLEAIL